MWKLETISAISLFHTWSNGCRANGEMCTVNCGTMIRMRTQCGTGSERLNVAAWFVIHAIYKSCIHSGVALHLNTKQVRASPLNEIGLAHLLADLIPRAAIGTR